MRVGGNAQDNNSVDLLTLDPQVLPTRVCAWGEEITEVDQALFVRLAAEKLGAPSKASHLLVDARLERSTQILAKVVAGKHGECCVARC